MLTLVFILAAVISKSFAADECAVSDYDKIDCAQSGIDQSGCEAKGCCWAESTQGSSIPWCFYKSGVKEETCYGFQSSMKEPFSDAEVSTMRGYYLKNINIDGKGGIVAAPDTSTPGGSYYYHWMRDGALTMRCLQETNPGNFTDIEETVKSYAKWVVGRQAEVDPNDIDIRTEPKFELPDGEVFDGGWCRPQNDGPGLRATALMIAAESLMAAGESDFVKQYLWTGSSSLNGGAIKYDLDYVVEGYATNTCDLWEEIRDPDLFWNRVTMKKAMILGAAFATKMGDSVSAQKYTTTMAAINSTLYQSHFNGGFVQECASRTRDSAVIVGFNDGFDESDGMFAPTSKEVAMTVSSYNTMFCNEYAINTADTTGGLPGVLYGRYHGDSYAGGNPWVLSTAALASLFYRGAAYILDNGLPDKEALGYWQQAFNTEIDLTAVRSTEALAQMFAAQGDGVLLRLRAHVEAEGFHLDEQIDRNTGVQMSAEDLTWSYAEVLNAMNYRKVYLNKLSRTQL